METNETSTRPAGAREANDMPNAPLIELSLDGIAQGGDGVGRHEGVVVFARGGLPGERVRVRLHERRASYSRGEVVEVLEAAPERVAPRVAGNNAPWQHIDYPAQLRFKETIVRDQLAKLAGLREPPVAPILAAPQPWGYRNTARLHVAGATIGYYAAGSHDIVDIAADPLLLPVLNEALAGLRAVLVPDLLRGVTLRASSAYGYSLAVLDPLPGAPFFDLELLATAWRSHVPSLAGVSLYDGVEGAASLRDELGGVIFDLSPLSFFQVNAAQAARMLAIVRERACPAPGGSLLDVYSGAGTFALPLAEGLAEVTAVEEHPAAVADGERSAALNNISNVRFIRGAAERALPGFELAFDAAVLDPPRRGCHPAVLDALARLAPPRLAYISCHPGILARDLGPLLAAGYALELVQPVDLFPQTPHIETLVILRADG
jgi:23S rRNA (uracil1939-C5)-methyltransferase